MPDQLLTQFNQAADVVDGVQLCERCGLEPNVECLTELAAEPLGPMLVFDQFANY